MKEILRYSVTAAIWIGFVVPVSIAANADPFLAGHAFIAFFALLMAATMTFFVWDGSRIILASLGYYESAESDGKRKHTNQNADATLLLLQLLSDDERKDIRQRLIHGNDGELPQIFANDTESEYSERY